VADGLVRRTKLPLLLIRAGLPLRCWEGGLHRILVPLDGSELAESILPRLADLARVARARLTLLEVIGPPMPELTPYAVAYLPEDDDVLAEQARAYLGRVAASLAERGVEADVEVAFGRPAERIAAAAAQHRFDLIAMATHGRGGMDRLIVGSVADEVLRQASVPLLLFRGP
jgi:nucleotide-binding universal stress UspA family protein